MNTKPSPALLAAALLAFALALPTAAFAFAEVARGSLTLNTTGRVAYDSNLTGNTLGQGDTVFTLAPTLHYNRAAGLGTIDASFGVALNRYLDLTAFNSEDLDASLRVSLPTPEGARQQGGINVGYTDLSRIDETVGTRVRAKTWQGSFSGTYRAGPRLDLRTNLSYSDSTRDLYSDRTQWSAGAGFDYTDFLGGFGLEGNYRHSDTQSSAFVLPPGALPGVPNAGSAINQTSDSVGGGLFYRFVSGLRASANVGYRWIERARTETLTGQTSNNGMTLSLKLDGPFLPPSRFPKLKSSFSLGVQKGETLGLNSRGSTTMVGDLSLAWQARERTALSFSASRSQGLSTNNLSTVDNTVQLGLTQRIGDRTTASASLAQEWNSYPGTGRSDSRTRGGVNLGYSLNKNWQLGTSYALTLSRSNNSVFDYDRHLVSAFVSCTF